MPQLPRSSRRQKIEPLNYAEAALAPALKGMTSFLDVSPEDVRNGRFESFGPRSLVAAFPPSESSPPIEISSDHVPSPGDETAPVGSRPRDAANILSRGVTPITAKVRSGTGSDADTFPRHAFAPEEVSRLEDELPVGYVSFSAPPLYPENVAPPGYDRSSISMGQVIPGRGRSKVRRAVLAQDGHSLGEEAIYQIMWRGGRPENGDPNCSRTIRIGAADIGYKVNMAKKNVRQNIARLFEKLALEIVEDFETMSSQARLYRVHSYKQILERRRAAGLEFILRNKGVVFCTKDGEDLVSSPAYLSSPGDGTSIRPAPPKKRRAAQSVAATTYQPPVRPVERVETSEGGDLETVSLALNRYWPVDEAAAVQLIRDCRRVRPDAKSEEIAFFVREKLELARQNRNITNPTGLILATVPQSFVGSTFLQFRRRLAQQAALAAEDAARKEKEREEMASYWLAERDRWEKVLSDPSATQQGRDAAEKMLRQLASCIP